MRQVKTLLASCAVAACTLAALVGCHRDSGVSAQPEPAVRRVAPAAAQRPAGPAELTAGMVEAATQGKSQLPVALKFELAQRPAVGQTLDIGLAVIPGIPAGPAAIEVSASDGLTVADGFTHLEIASVEPAQVYRQSIKVTPSVEGVLFVSLKVSLTHDQAAESRNFTLPVIVAGPPQGAQNPAH